MLTPSTSRRSRRALERIVGRTATTPRGRRLPALLVPEPRARAARARRARASASRTLPVSLSHEVAPIWREYERGTTVTVDAFTKPLFERYVDGVSRGARRRTGVGGTWSLLKSNGGHALAARGARAPGAPAALRNRRRRRSAAPTRRAPAGTPQALALDMGGTSCDVCLIVDGEPLYSSDFELEFGFPVSVPSVSTRTIGAGGGSIGWVDPGGFLQVGPAERGRRPRPGLLRPGRRGGDDHRRRTSCSAGSTRPSSSAASMPLDPTLARAALDALGGAARPRPTSRRASAMVRVCNENMANAIRIVTVEQGIDPRDFALVAFGGAGADARLRDRRRDRHRAACSCRRARASARPSARSPRASGSTPSAAST